MRVGLFGNSPAGHELAAGMQAAGHTVVPVVVLADAASCEALILAVDEARLPGAVELLAPTVRPGQIVIHTCLSLGVQVLDDLETRGAVVIAASPVSVQRWAVTTLDELGETIAGLILGEMGATGVAKTDAERGVLAARLAYAQMLTSLAESARHDVRLLMDEETDVGADADVHAVIAGYAHVDEPGLRRAYVEAARRYGEVEEREDMEMWALQEETR